MNEQCERCEVQRKLLAKVRDIVEHIKYADRRDLFSSCALAAHALEIIDGIDSIGLGGRNE